MVSIPILPVIVSFSNWDYRYKLVIIRITQRAGLGDIHKLRHMLRGAEGVDKVGRRDP